MPKGDKTTTKESSAEWITHLCKQGERAKRTEPREPTLEGLWTTHGKDKQCQYQQ